jgi:signal transduction histidine kinase
LRRATFDITGLPPTPSEVTAFLADDSPAAFTRVIDRLLESPAYGQRWARHWLDVVRFAESGGYEVEVDIGPLPSPIDGDLSTLIFRVAQEALTNVLKHAQARHVVIRLAQRQDQWLQFLVVDDGRGADVEAAFAKASDGHSTGLASMRERVRLFGGRFTVVSRPDEGMQLRVLIPLLQGDAAP